jgi:hypothetical protein
VKVSYKHGPGRQGNKFLPDKPNPTATSLELQEHETLLLPHLGERGALHGPRIEYRCGKGAAPEIPPEHLVAMDMPGKYRRELRWEVITPDHIRRMPKGEICRAHGGPLHAVVHAE